MKVSFQDGCKKIVDKLTALNYPPEEPQGPVEICDAISKLYTDRLSNIQDNTNAKIVYTYHEHEGTADVEGGCYAKVSETCPNTSMTKIRWTHQEWNHAGYMQFYLVRCSICGYEMDTALSAAELGIEGYPITRYHSRTIIKLKCGKTESTIESATIDFT